MGFFGSVGGFIKKIPGGIWKGAKKAPAVLSNPGVATTLALFGVPAGAIAAVVPIAKALESVRFRKFSKAYKQAKPVLEKYGITRRSDINMIIEIALALAEGRAAGGPEVQPEAVPAPAASSKPAAPNQGKRPPLSVAEQIRAAREKKGG